MGKIVLSILVAAAASAAASPDCEDWSAWPHLIARLPVPGTVSDLAVVGSRAYVTKSTYAAPFHVVDLSDPRHPVLGVAVDGIGAGGRIVAEGDRLCVVSIDGLHVLDLADPANPVLVGDLPGDYGAGRAVDVENGIAYVIGGGELSIVDVSDPASPTVVATLPDFWASDVAVTGTSLVVCSGPFLSRWDVSDPAAPVLVDSYETIPVDPFTETVGFATVALSGETVVTVRNYTYRHPDPDVDIVSRRAHLLTFDLSDLAQPLGIASLGGEHSGHVIAFENLAYVASRYTGLHVVDVSSPSDPVVVHRNWAGPADGIATFEVDERRFLCEGRGSLGVQVRDVTNPDRPHEVDEPGPDYFDRYRYHDVAAAGDLAYTVESFSAAPYGYGYALTAFDVSDPGSPVELGTTVDSWVESPYKEVVIAGDDLWLRGVGWLSRSRLTDPAQPEPPIRLPGLNLVSDVEAQDPLLWVARGYSGLLLLDASGPADPAVVAEVTDHPVGALSVDGVRMCTLGGGSFRTADVSEPAAPVFLGELPMSGSWVASRGDVAVVAQSTGTLRFVDVGNPGSPVELSSLPLPDECRDAAFHGSRLYVAAGPQGMLVVDLTDPLSPTIQGGLASDPSRAVMVHDGRLLFTELGGFHGLPLDCTATGGQEPPPAVAGFSRIWPNPFVAGTTVGYALDRAGPVRLELFDVTGRRVRTLFDGDRGAGLWTHDWNGLDVRGRPVPSGVYFLRLETAATSSVRRVIRLR